MPLRIEDYAMVGDRHTAALVGRDGSIDWLCLPRFDSEACFAALLGSEANGRWLIAPAIEVRNVQRRYREGTLILETDFQTDGGAVRLIDFMPHRTSTANVVRIVEGRSGQVPMRLELIIRFDYGRVVPWVRRIEGGIRAIAGPNTVRCRSDVEMRGENLKTLADFTVSAGQRVRFDLDWYPTHQPAPRRVDPEQALHDTDDWWRRWSDRCTYQGPWREAVLRSLITLKGLTFAPTGGIAAAPTTSLPEQLGSVRNWDYRYCWVRDATFTLYALMIGGYMEEAKAWREWLLAAVAGTPSDLQIMYGLAGERRLTELELDWLAGYDHSSPVRIGNDAHRQHQLDVYGEVMDAMHLARRCGLHPDENAWRVERAILDFLESDWTRPDSSLWEVRGPLRQYTHSKIMAWVAFDRAARAVETFGLPGDAPRWSRIRDQIHEQVCREGFDPKVNSFVQYYGSDEPDAALLMIPQVGFLPATDPRMVGTVAFIQRRLLRDGFVQRYITDPKIDALPPGEGAFLACTFWLADCLVLQGRGDEAKEIFQRMLDLRNDVGLLSEEYDPHARRFLGNFPQAFSHLTLVNTARNLSRSGGPAEDRVQTQPASWT